VLFCELSLAGKNRNRHAVFPASSKPICHRRESSHCATFRLLFVTALHSTLAALGRKSTVPGTGLARGSYIAPVIEICRMRISDRRRRYIRLDLSASISSVTRASLMRPEFVLWRAAFSVALASLERPHVFGRKCRVMVTDSGESNESILYAVPFAVLMWGGTQWDQECPNHIPASQLRGLCPERPVRSAHYYRVARRQFAQRFPDVPTRKTPEVICARCVLCGCSIGIHARRRSTARCGFVAPGDQVCEGSG